MPPCRVKEAVNEHDADGDDDVGMVITAHQMSEQLEEVVGVFRKVGDSRNSEVLALLWVVLNVDAPAIKEGRQQHILFVFGLGRHKAAPLKVCRKGYLHLGFGLLLAPSRENLQERWHPSLCIR